MSRGRARETALADLGHEIRGWQADQEIFDGVVAELAGLNRTDWRCLDILGTRGPMTAGQLAEAARLTSGALTAVVDHLEAAGLVRRVRDTVDRRKVIIETTPEVERRAAPVYGPLMADSAKAFARFDDAQLKVLTDFIKLEREMLSRHTARVGDMLPTRKSPPPARR